MSPASIESVHSKIEKLDLENDKEKGLYDPDEPYGGHEARRKLERKLLRKLDLRMSILIVIYILNYVRHSLFLRATLGCSLSTFFLRSTAITPRTCIFDHGDTAATDVISQRCEVAWFGK